MGDPKDAAALSLVGMEMANIGQRGQFGEWVPRHWSERGMGQYAHTEIYYVLWNGGGVMEGSFSAKAVASTRLRTLILT